MCGAIRLQEERIPYSLRHPVSDLCGRFWRSGSGVLEPDFGRILASQTVPLAQPEETDIIPSCRLLVASLFVSGKGLFFFECWMFVRHVKFLLRFVIQNALTFLLLSFPLRR